MPTWKRDVVSGLVVLVPILVSIYAVTYVYRAVGRVPLFRTLEPPLLRVGIILALFVGLVFAIGYLMRTALGLALTSSLDGVMNHIPVLRVVYNASQLAVETAVSGNAELRQPVKVHTWDGIRMTAFMTGKRAPDGRLLLFLPTAPNITSGYVIEVREEDVTPIDETVESALTRVISAGFGDRNDGLSIPVPVSEVAPSAARNTTVRVESDGGTRGSR